MNTILPALAAFLQAGSFTLDKVVLSFRRVDYKTYVGVSFPLIFAITLVIFFIFNPPLSTALLQGRFLWLIIISVALSLFTNLVFYRALDADKLGEIQTIDLLRNIPVIVFTGLIFTAERNPFIIAAALMASLAIAWSHWERRHFRLQKYTAAFFFWTLAIAPFGPVISKELLTLWHPISLELVRSGATAILLAPLYFRVVRRTPSKPFLALLATNILTSIAWILYYMSYQRSGVIYTILIFSLQPLLVYLASLFLLKESFHWKKAVAFSVVLISIALAQGRG